MKKTLLAITVVLLLFGFSQKAKAVEVVDGLDLDLKFKVGAFYDIYASETMAGVLASIIEYENFLYFEVGYAASKTDNYILAGISVDPEKALEKFGRNFKLGLPKGWRLTIVVGKMTEVNEYRILVGIVKAF